MAQTREELQRIYGRHLVRSSRRQSWWKIECQSVSPGLNLRPRIWWEEWNIVRNIPEPPRSVLVFTLHLPLCLLSHFQPDASLSSLCPPSNWFALFYLFSAAGSYSASKKKKKSRWGQKVGRSRWLRWHHSIVLFPEDFWTIRVKIETFELWHNISKTQMWNTFKLEACSQLSSIIRNGGGSCLFELPLNKVKVKKVHFDSFMW